MSDNSTALSYGWQDQPTGRGTLDILQACLITIWLLCWSSVCPNVAAPSDTTWLKLRHKLSLFLLALLGPEFIFMLAVGQWQSAKAVLEDFSALPDCDHRTLTHAFFADMGGFHIRLHDWQNGESTSVVVNGRQLYKLVANRHLNCPKISKEDITDRNKRDGVARLITAFQVVWFTSSIIGRLIQGLSVTTLELTTLAFVVLMLATSHCWHYKPMDVSMPIMLDSESPPDVLLEEIGLRPGSSQSSPGPPVFKEREEWFCSQFWLYYVQILRNIHLCPLDDIHYPPRRIPTVNFPPVGIRAEIVASLFIIAYGTVFMGAWNYTFPSSTETILWRYASVANLTYCVVGVLLAGLHHRGADAKQLIRQWCDKIRNPFKTRGTGELHELPLVLPRSSCATNQMGVSQPQPTLKSSSSPTARTKWDRALDRIRNISPNQDPTLTIPLRFLVPTTLACIVYCMSRAFIIIEDFISLRASPASTYDTVDWSKYLPHI